VPFVVGLVYFLFGIAAISYRSFNPPLFSFAVIGALLLLSSVMARGAPDQAQ
jgi:hypothetical protein